MHDTLCCLPVHAARVGDGCCCVVEMHSTRTLRGANRRAGVVGSLITQCPQFFNWNCHTNTAKAQPSSAHPWPYVTPVRARLRAGPTAAREGATRCCQTRAQRLRASAVCARWANMFVTDIRTHDIYARGRGRRNRLGCGPAVSRGAGRANVGEVVYAESRPSNSLHACTRSICGDGPGVNEHKRPTYLGRLLGSPCAVAVALCGQVVPWRSAASCQMAEETRRHAIDSPARSAHRRPWHSTPILCNGRAGGQRRNDRVRATPVTASEALRYASVDSLRTTVPIPTFICEQWWVGWVIYHSSS